MLLIMNLLRGGHDWWYGGHGRDGTRETRNDSERVKKSSSFFWSTSGRQSEGLHSVSQPVEIATGNFPAENGNRKEGC